ncbi:mandelate racemase/muconate lactonizing enzyme family protein [Roseomonas sp. KE2513]|uniref:mandelate racemase/muconate lactonizing enzyme family protein n=1 Tax=Roseomonas sp. KE2513 TaxID=2479202 RepID=UPI0018DF3BB6|nr:mandelate racemase/muconate lactonizing enzyme family protein [Roseomonas sp. KE2513]
MSGAATVRTVRLRRVQLQLGMVYVSSMYVMATTERTVIEVTLADGTVGLGETLGYPDCYDATTRLAPSLVGRDAMDRAGFRRSFARSVFDNRQGRIGWSAFAGLELALWDAAGKRLGLPLRALMGAPGPVPPVPLCCPLPAVALAQPASRAEIAAGYRDLSRTAALGELAAELSARHGFRAFKYKSAASSADWDVAAMGALREALGPEAAIRIDPNAGWPTAAAVRLAERLRPHTPEWLEDPCDDREGLARLRGATGMTVATNMAVIQPDHIPAALRLPGADVWLGDVFMWGGIEGWRDMAAAAALFGVEVALHSLFETGIATAANLHLAAAHPAVRRATDCGAAWLSSDVVTGLGPIRDGAMAVPDGPGLGVALDEAATAAVTTEERRIT